MTKFAYDGDNAFADLSSTNTLQTRRFWSDDVDQLFARVNSGGTAAWYLTDYEGSVVGMVDASGTPQATVAYDGFGNVTSNSNSSFTDRYLYTGQEFNSTTGLQSNGARYYNPSLGRWTQPDPIGMAGGDSNLYRYTGNDPSNLVDPSGLSGGAPTGGAVSLTTAVMLTSINPNHGSGGASGSTGDQNTLPMPLPGGGGGTQDPWIILTSIQVGGGGNTGSSGNQSNGGNWLELGYTGYNILGGGGGTSSGDGSGGDTGGSGVSAGGGGGAWFMYTGLIYGGGGGGSGSGGAGYVGGSPVSNLPGSTVITTVWHGPIGGSGSTHGPTRPKAITTVWNGPIGGGHSPTRPKVGGGTGSEDSPYMVTTTVWNGPTGGGHGVKATGGSGSGSPSMITFTSIIVGGGSGGHGPTRPKAGDGSGGGGGPEMFTLTSWWGSTGGSNGSHGVKAGGGSGGGQNGIQGSGNPNDFGPNFYGSGSGNGGHSPTRGEGGGGGQGGIQGGENPDDFGPVLYGKGGDNGGDFEEGDNEEEAADGFGGPENAAALAPDLEQDDENEPGEGDFGGEGETDPHQSCFPAGTLVSTETGLRPIETIGEGDRVWAIDLATGDWMLRDVIEVYRSKYSGPLLAIHTVSESVNTTPSHPFWVIEGLRLSDRPCSSHLPDPPNSGSVSGRWVAACDLQVEDRLLLREGTTASVNRVSTKSFDGHVFNFKVQEFHCYAVGKDEILMHNKAAHVEFGDNSDLPDWYNNLVENGRDGNQIGIYDWKDKYHPDAFDQYDRNKDGFITPDEIRHWQKQHGVAPEPPLLRPPDPPAPPPGDYIPPAPVPPPAFVPEPDPGIDERLQAVKQQAQAYDKRFDQRRQQLQDYQQTFPATAELLVAAGAIVDFTVGGAIAPRPTGILNGGLRAALNNCFPEDTLVASELGLKPIREIDAGDRVWSYDFEAGDWRLCQVECRHDSDYKGPVVTIDLGLGEVRSTAFHPFWVVDGNELMQRPTPRHVSANEDQSKSLAGRWVNSHDLQTGDTVLLKGGGRATIHRISQIDEELSVCNLTINDLHTFTVGESGALVHNRSGTIPIPSIGFPGNLPSTKSPGAGFEWRGLLPIGGRQGNWFNPSTGESLSNDMNNAFHGPHWDYRIKGSAGKWRWFPDGRMEYSP